MLLGWRNIYKICFLCVFMGIKYFVYSGIIAVSLVGCMKVRFNNHGERGIREGWNSLMVPVEEREKFEWNGRVPDWIYDENEGERKDRLEKPRYENNRPFPFDPRPKLDEVEFERV